jgi:PKHD-type hydroxylase
MYHLKNEPFEAFVTVPAAFAPHEIDAIRSYLDVMETAVVADGEKHPEIRESRIKWLAPEDVKYQWVFAKLTSIINEVNPKFFGIELRAIEAIQLTEYDAEYVGHYGAHTDNSYGYSRSRNRKLSLVMQLTDPEEYEGGELKLYWASLKEPAIGSKARGDMTLFRSHILHEVTPLTKGKRLSLVAWVQGPLYK